MAENMAAASPGPVYPKQPTYGLGKKGKSFEFGKLQFAGILLIGVFVWCVISAVTLAMFEIHVLALTEFEDDSKSDVYGYVTDENGLSLVNVTVSIHGTHHFAKTNADGYYSMENVREGDYEIEASLDGYGSIVKRVSLSANSPTLINFMLEEGGFDKTVNDRHETHLSELRYLNYSTAIFIVVFGSLALIGGILAFFKKFYWFAMFGGLCGFIGGVLSIGIVIGPILSILALILIITNHEDFTEAKQPSERGPFGIRRAEGRAASRPKVSPQKPRPAAPPVKLGAKEVGPRYAQTGFPPPPPPPRPQAVEAGGKPGLVCIVCDGTIKAEAHGIACECGAWYHKFCAGSMKSCKQCGAPL
ncbi:MAG: carboxypeptidase regulatory-like domain-containing protein [Thermoplasmata archaeon]|nr:MAG: carboxypeptidase regulatory-like domain-containing protein [Thermoplasmata archaeon]